MSWPQATVRQPINTTTNQKHAGMTEKGKERRFDWQGAGGTCDFIVLGQSSWGIIETKIKLMSKLNEIILWPICIIS